MLTINEPFFFFLTKLTFQSVHFLCSVQLRHRTLYTIEPMYFESDVVSSDSTGLGTVCCVERYRLNATIECCRKNVS